jgi:hypothetical protein
LPIPSDCAKIGEKERPDLRSSLWRCIPL